LFKEIDAYHGGPKFSVMNVLNGLNKASKYWETF